MLFCNKFSHAKSYLYTQKEKKYILCVKTKNPCKSHLLLLVTLFSFVLESSRITLEENLQVSFDYHSLFFCQIPFFKSACLGINFLVRYISTQTEMSGSCFILEQFYSLPVASLLSLPRILVFSLLKLNLLL